MRMKHGSDRGPTTLAKPRLLAAFTAVAMMFATAVPALLPKSASADDAQTTPGICVPENINLGETTTGGTVDTGVATWVGRDMYVGKPTGATDYGYGEATIGKSYAVEAEGATLVAGKLAINSQKNSWNNRGFRFGIVGFGAQYRPAQGSDALVVAGTNSVINLKGGDGADTNALGWAAYWGRGWVGTLNSGEWNYNARISGNKSQTVYDYDKKRNDSVYADNEATPNSQVLWGQSNPLSNVNLSGSAGATSDYTKNTETIQQMSETLARVPSTGDAATPIVVDSGTYENGKYNGTYTYEKFNSGQPNGPNSKSPYIGANITFANENGKKEKIIVFDGKNTTARTIVFSIEGAQLADGNDYNGTSFMFKNIPDDASVVVNVSGKAPISFHNGWRFWWNGQQIGNGYYHGSTPAVKKAYNRAAQAIMWNFYETTYLNIGGGVLTPGQAVRWANTGSPNNMATTVSDDPAAAMIGSIMVPKGSFEDHVTTNGRVWVGEDFMMYNPTVAAKFGDGIGQGDSASILDMDQERHNFPWKGSMRSECSTIAWSKIDDSGALLSGTSWGLYGSLDDAVHRRNGIYPNIEDNNIPSGDWNNEGGKFRVDSLTPGHDYYIREIETVTGHQLNDNIYVINATNTGSAANTIITAVYTGSGQKIENTENQGIGTITGTSISAIVNPADEGKVNWGKYAEGSDQPYKGLEGSEWYLQKEDSPNPWTITDNTTSVTGLKVYKGDILVADSTTTNTLPSVTVGEFQQVQLDAVVEPTGASQRVNWESNNENVHVSNGLVNVVAYPGEGVRVSITVTTEDTDASGNPISVTIPLEITQAEVDTLMVKNGETIIRDGESITVEEGSNLQLTASVTPTNLRPTFIWSSGNQSVATVDATGNVHGVAAGDTTITVTAGNKSQTISVTVTSTSHPLTIYIKWANASPYLYWYDAVDETGEEYPGYPMKAVPSCGKDWYSYEIPFGSGKEFSFIVNNHDNNKFGIKVPANQTEFIGLEGSGGKFLSVKAMGNFSAYTINENGNTEIAIGAPSCAATFSGRKNSAVVPQSNLTVEDLTKTVSPSNATNAPVMLRARQAQMRDAANDNTPQDVNSKVGEFSVALENGTYMLWEKTAPAGYMLNTTKYRFTITDGKVEWIGDAKPSIVGEVGWISDKPTKVNWAKVDETNTSELLGGSQWGIYEKKNGTVSDTPVQLISDCVAGSAQECAIRYANQKYFDSNPDEGKFTVEKLSTGTYVLKETIAPTGYQLLEETKEFTINTDSEDAVNITVDPIVNKRLLGTVDWTKVNSEALNGTPLAGAEWTIKFKAQGEDEYGTEYTIVDCTSGDCAVLNGAKQPTWTYDRDPAVGVFKLENLQWGEYSFYESKAPDGYYPSDKTYTFTVDKDNLTGIVISNSLAETSMASGNKIPNEPGFELPSTGGEGNTLIVLFGFALIAISMLGCAIAMRKRI